MANKLKPCVVTMNFMGWEGGRNKRIVYSLINAVICVLFSCISCSNTNIFRDTLITRLKDRGIVVVSPDNPYLAGNLFLSKQRQESPEVDGFLKGQGLPSALEVEQEFFQSIVLNFYYPVEGELYTLEQTQESWLINGPFRIPEEKQATLKTLLHPSLLKPYEKHLNRTSESKAPSATLPSPSPLPLNRTKEAPPSEPTDSTFIQELLHKFSTSQAELSPRGDLVHYVTFSGETLSLIARWYTYERNNAEKIGRINQLKNFNTLSIGDTIIIPSYMLKNKVRLTEKVLRELIEHYKS